MDYEKMKKEELFAVLQERKIEANQKVKKEELISLLKKSDEKEKKAAKKKEKPVKTEEERAPKKKKRKKAKKEEPSSMVQEKSARSEAIERSKRRRRSGRKAIKTKSDFLRIDGDDKFQRNLTREEQDSIDLMASYDIKMRKVLRGKVYSVKKRTYAGEPMPLAVISYGTQEVLIPGNHFLDDWDKITAEERNKFLNKRLGEETEFLVLGYNDDGGERYWLGSRTEAMKKIRENWWFKKNPDGTDKISVGARVEGRVNAVVREFAFIEVFGVECKVPLRELSHSYVTDAQTLFNTGDRVAVVVTKAVRNEKDRTVIATFSIRAASENPQAKFADRAEKGEWCKGTVVNVRPSDKTVQFFVNVENRGVVLCRNVTEKIPKIGDEVVLRI